MKRYILKFSIIFLILSVLSFASIFTNKEWSGTSFPYKGALFLHDGDYVEFYCDSAHSKFYYWTLKSGDHPIEIMERKPDGWKQIKVIILPPTSTEFKGNFKDYNGWGVYDLSNVSGCMNKQIALHLRENRTIGGKTYGDKDIVIRLMDRTDVKFWKGVDSYDKFDLDSKALKDDQWIVYANNLADRRIATIDKIIETFWNINYINELNEAQRAGLGSLLGGIGNSYFPNDHLTFTSDCIRNISAEYISVYSQYMIKVQKSLNYVVCNALADVYSGAFEGIQYINWMINIMNKAIPTAVATVQEAYNRTVEFKSLVAKMQNASLSKLENLKQYITDEKNARISKNKEALRNALNNQLKLIYSETCDSNSLFTSDQNISNIGDLSLWHFYGKVRSIAKSRESDNNYPNYDRQAYTMLKILAEKLIFSMTNLELETLWVKNAEENYYFIK